MQTTTVTPTKVILRKGGAIVKPKPASNPTPTKSFYNPRFKNCEGKKFYLFPVMGSYECP